MTADVSADLERRLAALELAVAGLAEHNRVHCPQCLENAREAAWRAMDDPAERARERALKEWRARAEANPLVRVRIDPGYKPAGVSLGQIRLAEYDPRIDSLTFLDCATGPWQRFFTVGEWADLVATNVEIGELAAKGALAVSPVTGDLVDAIWRERDEFQRGADQRAAIVAQKAEQERLEREATKAWYQAVRQKKLNQGAE